MTTDVSVLFYLLLEFAMRMILIAKSHWWCVQDGCIPFVERRRQIRSKTCSLQRRSANPTSHVGLRLQLQMQINDMQVDVGGFLFLCILLRILYVCSDQT